MNISTLQIRKLKTEVIEYNSHEATGDGGTELQWEARQSNLILIHAPTVQDWVLFLKSELEGYISLLGPSLWGDHIFYLHLYFSSYSYSFIYLCISIIM